MRAASSSSRGMPAKKLRSRKIANGSPNATWNSTTPRMSPKMPEPSVELRHRDQRDLDRHHEQRDHDHERQSRPGKSIQANAYAGQRAMPTTSRVAGTVMSTVFQNESR